MANLLRRASLRRAVSAVAAAAAPCPESYKQGICGSTFNCRYFSSKAKKKTKSSGTDSGEENLSKKDLALHQAIDQITSAFGKGAIMWLGRSEGRREVPVVSTGSFSLDLALGIGGLPKIRSKVTTFGGFGGPMEVTSGGNALKFYASVRMNIKRIGLVKKGEETIGSQVLVKIVKNKHAPPFKTAQFELEFGKGICRSSELIELGLKHKLVKKLGGAFYSFNEESYRGKDALKSYLNENESVAKELETNLRKLMETEAPKKQEDEGDFLNDLPEETLASETSSEEELAAVMEA